MFNKNAEDGIGYYSGLGVDQCDVLLADPTKSRYCLEHARQMGVDYYAPPELAEAVAQETATNLTRLVPKATRVLEIVMDDEDAPQGVRAKAACGGPGPHRLRPRCRRARRRADRHRRHHRGDHRTGWTRCVTRSWCGLTPVTVPGGIVDASTDGAEDTGDAGTSGAADDDGSGDEPVA